MHGGRRIGEREQVLQFRAHAFAAQPLQRRGQRLAGCTRLGIPLVAEPCGEAEIPQDAQMVFADSGCRIADEAHAACGEIVEAAEIIVHHQRQRMRIKRVDCEIPPRRIVAPLLTEGDRGVAPVGLDIAPQRGDLDIAVVEHGCHRAMVDPRGDRANACRLAPVDHGRGQVAGRRIDIVRREPEQRIAHAAAHPADVVGTERIDQPGEIVAGCPVGCGKGRGHRSASFRLRQGTAGVRFAG